MPWRGRGWGLHPGPWSQQEGRLLSPECPQVLDDALPCPQEGRSLGLALGP